MWLRCMFPDAFLVHLSGDHSPLYTSSLCPGHCANQGSYWEQLKWTLTLLSRGKICWKDLGMLTASAGRLEIQLTQI